MKFIVVQHGDMISGQVFNLYNFVCYDEIVCTFSLDYTNLTIFKPMFPDIPILGLTATASSKGIVDTQKLLQIQGCALLKASFNRPNLYYEVLIGSF